MAHDFARDFDAETARRARPAEGAGAKPARSPATPPPASAIPTPEMTAEVLASGGMVSPDQLAPPLTAPRPTMQRSHWQGMSPGAMVGVICMVLAAIALAATFLVHSPGVGS
jgi:hypothetical protein